VIRSESLRVFIHSTALLCLAIASSRVAQAHSGPHLAAYPMKSIVLDGDLSDWPADAREYSVPTSNAKNLDCHFRLGFDRSAGVLFVGVVVRDDHIVLEGKGQPWNAQDSLEVFVDADHGAKFAMPAQFYYRKGYGAGLDRNTGNGQVARKVGDGVTTYEWRIDVAGLRGKRGFPTGEAILGFDLVVQDRDAADTLTVAQWTTGTEKWRDRAGLGDLYLLGKPTQLGRITGNTAWKDAGQATPPQFVYARKAGNEAVFVRATTGTGGAWSIDLPPGRYTLRAADAITAEHMSAAREVTVAAGKTVALREPLRTGALKGTVDELVPALMAELGVRAVSIATFENGRIRYSRAFGIDAAGKPATRETTFRIASITKTLSTMTVLSLVQQGKWNLDEPLHHHWIDPDIAADPRTRLITTRLALQHQTGLPNWRQGQQLAFLFAPGERQGYSGEGFEYVRRAVERATGMPLEELATNYVFKPAGMLATSYLWPDWVEQRFAGMYAGEEYIGYPNRNEANAAANMMSNADDLARFGIWVMNGGGITPELWREVEDTSKPIATESPTNPRHGIGWMVTRDGARQDTLVLHHGGGQAGIRTEIVLVPGRKQGLVVLTNSSAGGPILLAALNATLNKNGEFPRIQYFFEDRARN
jgi:CubicO group peptidase (beta-lactamase class C family)